MDEYKPDPGPTRRTNLTSLIGPLWLLATLAAVGFGLGRFIVGDNPRALIMFLLALVLVQIGRD